MKRLAMVIAVLFVVALVCTIRRASSARAQILRHQEVWQQAVQAEISSAPLPVFRRLTPFRDKARIYWLNKRQLHESELLKLGYLTNYELRLSNQVMTPAFHSNFFWRIRAELGTNADQVWVGTPLPNNAGLKPLLPTKDLITWERIFRDCAIRYASNIAVSNVSH